MPAIAPAVRKNIVKSLQPDRLRQMEKILSLDETK